MKNVAVAGIAWLLVYLGWVYQQGDPARALWGLGLLLVTGHIVQQGADAVGVPRVTAWLLAGLALGASGLRVVHPLDLPPLALAGTVAGVCVGFRVGLEVLLPARRDVGLMAGVTLATAVLVATAAVGVFHLGIPAAVMLGGLACLWAPFSFVPRSSRRFVLSLAAVGTVSGLVILSLVTAGLLVRGDLGPEAGRWLARVWGSLIAGAAAGAALLHGRPFDRQPQVLAIRVAGTVVVVGVAVYVLGLFALPCGLGAGLVVAHRRVPARRVRSLLRATSPAPFLMFFGLMGADLDLRTLWPPVPPAVHLLLAELGVVWVVRGWGAALMCPGPGRSSLTARGLRWTFLPRGALLYELALASQDGFISLVGVTARDMIRQLVTADVLVHLLVVNVVFLAVERRFPPACSRSGGGHVGQETHAGS